MPDKHWQITVLFLCICCEKYRPESQLLGLEPVSWLHSMQFLL